MAKRSRADKYMAEPRAIWQERQRTGGGVSPLAPDYPADVDDLIDFARINGSILARPCCCYDPILEQRWRFYRHKTAVICWKCGKLFVSEGVAQRERARKLAASLVTAGFKR
jgi:hypothetical protein